MGRTLQDALRQQTLARRSADQLQHDVGPDLPSPRAERLERGGQTRPPADQGADGDGGRTREARVQPRRRPRHGPAARRGLRHRPENRGDRGPRGGPPADPDHRPGRHQLRPDPGRLRDPGERRRDPLLPADHRHDRRRGRGRLLGLARAGGASDRRGNGAAQTRRGRAQETRGGRESSPPGPAGQRSRGRSGQTGGRQSRGRETAGGRGRCRESRSGAESRPGPATAAGRTGSAAAPKAAPAPEAPKAAAPAAEQKAPAAEEPKAEAPAAETTPDTQKGDS